MLVCPSCGTKNPANARFCLECGTRLEAATPPQEERRVVTILFVDLIGFTERSDRADPEDVRRSLVPFHSRVKEDIEAFGGTLDKFIGDAVMGVFGAPVAHDDDQERAVRAALRILDTIGELHRDDPDIAVRIAVETGEAVVTFGAGPQVGEAVAGDVVNTTSRMQALAPRDGLVVGPTTNRAIRHIFETSALAPASVKGKAEPIRVWQVLGERAQAADIMPTAFVGRERELGRLREVFDRVVASGSVHLISVVGEPGIGKSRLVAEFRRRVGRARWIAGRCVPYGEAVTLSAVAGMVREIAHIPAGAEPEETSSALGGYVESIEEDPAERQWLLSRLAAVLGVSERGPDLTIPPREIADAWARAVRSAGDGPTILEIEDLHWAEPALLRTVEALLDLLADRAVLVVCATRPGSRERTDRWPPDRPEVSTLELPALSEDETSTLLAALLSRAVMAEDARNSLLQRAGGNPLYALEFARMMGEHTGDATVAEPAMPDTVQSVISARLDGIPRELRSLVQDASVVGTTFWPGALAAMGDVDETEVRAGLEELARRGLVQPAPVSSFEGQPEFGFTHALIGEVAYRRIPRGRRARRHCAAGTWIEEQSGDRAEDRAEPLALHFSTAVELAEAAEDDEVLGFARGPAIRWSMTAGDRARRLDAGGAFTLYDRAARLATEGGAIRAEALNRSARMGRRSGRIPPAEVLSRYEESLRIRRVLGDPLRIGEMLTRLGAQAGAMGDSTRSHDLLAEAIDVLEAEPPGWELARAYAFRAEEEMFAGRGRDAMAFADRALGPGAEAAGHDETVIMALHIRGDARCSLGDERGLEDLERALELSRNEGDAADIVTSGSYLGEWLWAMEGPAVGLDHYLAGLEIAERRGVVDQGLWLKADGMGMLFDLGDWDRALQWAKEILEIGRDRLDPPLHAAARIAISRIESLRGRPDRAGTADELLALVGPVEEPQVLAPALAVAAHLEVEAGRASEALAHLRRFDSVTRDVAAEYRESQLAAVVRDCVRIGASDLADELIDRSVGAVRRDALNLASARAGMAEVSGDPAAAAAAYAAAAKGWRTFGCLYEESEACRGVVRCDPPAPESAARADEIAARLGVPVR